ncbi:hypothetical protein [Streptomyces sp. NPDC057302]|uniref:hypothetical protein n=1 Tax=Streptomyces sp. NPDC057302 TaxID=3346094 RepID=UPI00363B22D0
MPAPLPVHPLTGARALGWRKARTGEDDSVPYPIWPILGAAEDDENPEGAEGDEDPEGEGDPEGDPEGEGDPDHDPEADPEGAEELGDKGKRALASMKGKWRSERDKRRQLEQEMAQKSAGDEEAAARQEVEQAALSKANARIVRAEVKAAAKGVLADPADAYKFLDLDQFEVDENGDLDSDEVTEAIDELIKSKPYLAAAPAKRFQGTGDGGAARKAGRPKQLSRQDLKSMSPDAIEKARLDGRLDDVMGGK